jgi:hypothetical protein
MSHQRFLLLFKCSYYNNISIEYSNYSVLMKFMKEEKDFLFSEFSNAKSAMKIGMMMMMHQPS